MHDQHQVEDQDNKEDDDAAGVAVAFGKKQEENPQRTGDHAEEADKVDENGAIGRWDRHESLFFNHSFPEVKATPSENTVARQHETRIL